MDNEKTRIFCVITQGELGGAQQFASQLARHLNPERFALHVVWGPSGGNDLGDQLPSHVTHAVAKNLVRPISPLKDLHAIRELTEMMNRWEPDVVLCISSKAGFVGALAAARARRHLPLLRVIYRIGGWTFNDPWSPWKKQLYLWLERWSARYKDTIVVNNQHDLDQARMLGIAPRQNIVCIHNGIDPYLPMPSKDQARMELAKHLPPLTTPQTPDYMVGTIANLYPAKDIPNLIAAAARVGGNIQWVVIGQGHLKTSLQALIKHHGLEQRFFLVGSLAQARQYLPAFDAFVLSSSKEGFPWAVLEAMAAKVPVVATRVGAIPEMLTDHKSALLVEPGRPADIANAVVALLKDAELGRDLAIAAHQEVIARFSLHQMVSVYEKLFVGHLNG